MTRRLKTSGFTLVEVLIGSCVLVVLFAGCWMLFSTVRRMNDISTWQTARQVEMRVGLQMVREDLMRACYPTIVDRASSEVVQEASHRLFFKDGGPHVLSSAPAGEYLRFYACKPSKNCGTSSDTPGNVMECKLSVEGTSLRYERIHGPVPGITGNEPDMPAFNKLIINDVAELNIQLSSTASAEYTMNFCTMSVRCLHPKPDCNTQVTEETGAKIEVDFEGNL